MKLRSAIFATVWAVAIATGCGNGDDGETATIDPAQIEPELRDDLSQSVGVDPSTVSLDCPSGEPAEEGHRFECTLTAPDGTTAIVRVTVTRAVVSGDDVDYEVQGVVPRGQFK